MISKLWLSALICAGTMHGKSKALPVEHYLTHEFQVITPCGLSFVDACFVINLDHRKDRWAYMQGIAANADVAFTRVPAVHGADLPAGIASEIGQWNPWIKRRRIAIRPNQLGCLLSHLSLLLKADQLYLDRIWVFEDDILPHVDLSSVKSLMEAIEAKVGKDGWDIIYTDHRKSDTQISMGIFEQVKARYGTYSMLVSQSGRRKVLDYYRTYGVLLPIDSDLGKIRGMRLYQPKEDLVGVNRDFESDIRGCSGWGQPSQPVRTLATPISKLHK